MTASKIETLRQRVCIIFVGMAATFFLQRENALFFFFYSVFYSVFYKSHISANLITAGTRSVYSVEIQMVILLKSSGSIKIQFIMFQSHTP